MFLVYKSTFHSTELIKKYKIITFKKSLIVQILSINYLNTYITNHQKNKAKQRYQQQKEHHYISNTNHKKST